MRHTPGKRWRHIIFNTHNSWLHGDPRGFRDRNHRIHSSGDYRNPPPRTEHVGLRGYYGDRSGEAFRLPRNCLAPVGHAISENLSTQNHAIEAISVNPTHVHLLVELPDDVTVIKRTIGWCKSFATKAARGADVPITSKDIWAAGLTYKPVDEPSHFEATRRYIALRQGADAWIWANSP